MRSTFNAVAFLTLGLLGGYLLNDGEPPAVLAEDENAAATPWNPLRRGDVNADGLLDVSDAMFILNYCFLGGPLPSELPVTRGQGVLQSGQTLCFDGVRGLQQDPCPAPGTADYGQDANFLAGIPRQFELVKVDETAADTWYTVDHATGLMWQYRDEVKRHWRGALESVESLELGGFDDWRMPNIRELLTIVNFGRRNPCAYPEFFEVVPTVYWSSTTSMFDGSRVFTVRFTDGFLALHEKGQAGIGPEHFFCLAVRNLD